MQMVLYVSLYLFSIKTAKVLKLQKKIPEQVRVVYFACDVHLSRPYYVDNCFTKKKRTIGKNITSINGDTLNIIS